MFRKHTKFTMQIFCPFPASAGSDSPWWSVDLAVNREIVYVRIFNRRDDEPEWYTHTCTHTHTHTRTHTYVHAHTFTYIYIYTHTHT